MNKKSMPIEKQKQIKYLKDRVNAAEGRESALGQKISDLEMEVSLISDAYAQLKSVKTALSGSEEMLSQIVSGTAIPMFVVDKNHKVTHWNKACEKTFNTSAREFIGTSNQWKPFYPKKRPVLADLILNKITKKNIKKWYTHNSRIEVKKSTLLPGAYEGVGFFSHIGDNGMWISFTAAPIKNKRGEVVGAVETLDDITVRKVAEEKIKENEEKFRNIIESAHEALYRMLVPSGKYEYISPASKEVFGYSQEEWYKNPLFVKKIIHSDFLDYFKARWKEMLQGKVLPEYEYKIIDKKGDERWIQQSNTAVYDEKNKIYAVEGICRDITDKKNAEENLRESENLHRNLVEQAGDGIMLIQDSHFIFVNPQLAKLLGYSVKEITNVHFKKVLHPSELKKVSKRYYNRMQGKNVPKIYDTAFIGKNGEKIDIEINASVIQHKGKTTDLVFARDIRERKVDQKKLIENEKRFRDLYENLPGSAYRCTNDKYWTMQFISNAIKDISGYSPSEIVGNKKISFEKIIHPDDRAMVRRVINKSIRDKKSFEIDYRIITKKGEVKWVHERGKAVFGAMGKIKYIDGLHFDITDRRKINQALESQRELSQKYLDLVRAMIIVFDKKGDIIMVNKKGIEILEGKEASIVGKNWFSCFLPKKIRSKVKNIFKEVFLGRFSVVEYHENEILTKKGNKKLLSWHNSVIRNGKGEIVSLIAAGEDITEKNRIEKELADSEKKYRTLVESASDTILSIGKNGKILDINKKIDEEFGYDKKDIVGKNIKDLTKIIPKESMITVLKNFAKRFAGVEVTPYVVSMILKKGKIGFFEISASLIKEDKKIVGAIAILRDVTEREKTRQILKEREEKFRTLFEAANDAIFIMKGDKFVDCNEKTLKMFACKRNQIIGKTPFRFSPLKQVDGKSSKSEAMKKIKAALSSGPQFFEWIHSKHDGTLFNAEVGLNKIVVEDEVYLQAIVRDTTKRKKTESELEESEEKLRIIIESIGDGVFVVDKNFKILMFNKQASIISGYSEKEVLGKKYNSVLKFVHEETGEEEREFIDKSVKHSQVSKISSHTQLIKKDGARVYVGDSAAPVKDSSGNVVGGVVVFRDVSEETATDKAKSEFVSVASHQLKTPLSGIKWLTELLLSDKLGSLNENQEDFIVKIRESNQRLINLVTDLLDVSHIETKRKFDIKKRRIDLCNLVADIVSANTSLIKKRGVKIKKDKSCVLSASILADKDKIYQVIDNLMTNAIKYSKPGGEIWLGVEVNNGEIVFYVKDSGVGIDQRDHKKVFSKFYRSDDAIKLETDGTGLGLYIAKAIVEAHGGKMWFESVKGKGSTFYFSLGAARSL